MFSSLRHFSALNNDKLIAETGIFPSTGIPVARGPKRWLTDPAIRVRSLLEAKPSQPSTHRPI